MTFFSYYLAWWIMVNTLIGELGADQFAQRQSAYECLRALLLADDGLVYLGLIEEGVKNPDPEISFRCQQLAGEYLTLEPKYYPAIPVITMLPDDFDYREEIIEDFSARARAICANDVAGEMDSARLATQLYLEALLRHGYPRSQAQVILETMEIEELFVEERQKKRWNFPAKYHPLLLR